MRKLLVPVAGALLLAGALSPVAAVERGGELTFGRYADSLLLDPVWNDANVDIWIFTNLYDTLIRSSPDGNDLEPGLATEWAVSDDGTEVTLTLREGVKFADGSDMTAEDARTQWAHRRLRRPRHQDRDPGPSRRQDLLPAGRRAGSGPGVRLDPRTS
jgi:peptide/nickel transport system substrate-binding protein